jgi:hypothetical protein
MIFVEPDPESAVRELLTEHANQRSVVAVERRASSPTYFPGKGDTRDREQGAGPSSSAPNPRPAYVRKTHKGTRSSVSLSPPWTPTWG